MVLTSTRTQLLSPSETNSLTPKAKSVKSSVKKRKQKPSSSSMAQRLKPKQTKQSLTPSMGNTSSCKAGKNESCTRSQTVKATSAHTQVLSLTLPGQHTATSTSGAPRQRITRFSSCLTVLTRLRLSVSTSVSKAATTLNSFLLYMTVMSLTRAQMLLMKLNKYLQKK